MDIQDGDKLLKGIWTIEPTVALDIYTAGRTSKAKRVTFITDIESMSFDVQPGHTYDFVILLDGKDACPTRLSTMKQGCRRVGASSDAGPPTLPITIRNGKLHCQGTINDSETLDLIFDTGADTNVVYPSGMEKGANPQFDGTVQSAGTGGATTRQTSSDNRLEVTGLWWDHEPVLYVEKQVDAADGVVGFPVFEDKVIELDYDRMVMTIHDELPAHAAGFAKTALSFQGSLTSIEAKLVNGEKVASGQFILDTGGDSTLLVNKAFAAGHGLHGTMKKLGTSSSRGVGSGVILNEIARLPVLTIAGFELHDVPISMELPSEGNEEPPGGALCMEVLRRFNLILDYPGQQAYLKPNTHFSDPF